MPYSYSLMTDDLLFSHKTNQQTSSDKQMLVYIYDKSFNQQCFYYKVSIWEFWWALSNELTSVNANKDTAG